MRGGKYPSAWRSERAGVLGNQYRKQSKALVFCSGRDRALARLCGLGAGSPPGPRTPEGGPLSVPAAAGFSAPRFPAPQGLPGTGKQGGAAAVCRAAAGARLALPLAGAPGEGGTRRRGRPPCPDRSSPPRPPARRPRGTACRSPCEAEQEAAAAKAPPPWRASRPGGLRRTHGGFLARAVPAGRRPPSPPALGSLAARALALGLGIRGGRAVAEPGPHQDPLVRQHCQCAGAAGRRRHRAPCGAPGPRRRHATGHRAQIRSHGEQGAPRRLGLVARAGARGGTRSTGGRAGSHLFPGSLPARAENRGSGLQRWFCTQKGRPPRLPPQVGASSSRCPAQTPPRSVRKAKEDLGAKFTRFSGQITVLKAELRC